MSLSASRSNAPEQQVSTWRLTVFWRLGGGSSGTTPDIGSCAPLLPMSLFTICEWCIVPVVPTLASGRRGLLLYELCCAWFCGSRTHGLGAACCAGISLQARTASARTLKSMTHARDATHYANCMRAVRGPYHAGSEILPLLLHVLLHRRANWTRAAVALLMVLQQLPRCNTPVVQQPGSSNIAMVRWVHT